jgi:hypothetical protein
LQIRAIYSIEIFPFFALILIVAFGFLSFPDNPVNETEEGPAVFVIKGYFSGGSSTLPAETLISALKDASMEGLTEICE